MSLQRRPRAGGDQAQSDPRVSATGGPALGGRGDDTPSAEISEVFSSLQGEGPYLGKRQIFVRFGRCNMHCAYCDEFDKMQPGAYKDVDLEGLLGSVEGFERAEPGHHSVSLTGGEPLFYPHFLKSFLPELKRRGFSTYLETNGVLPGALVANLEHVDIVAMDIKPPSSTKDRPFWDSHRRFLEIASQKDVFVKVVITSETLLDEILRSIEIVRAVRPSIPFIFQPETEAFGISLKALRKIREEFAGPASEALSDVRIIPQRHKIWGVR